MGDIHLKKLILFIIFILTLNLAYALKLCDTEVETGKQCLIAIYLKNESFPGEGVASATCRLDIKFSNYTIYLDDQSMTDRGNGDYTYTFTAPGQIDDYIFLANCTKGVLNQSSMMALSVVADSTESKISSIKETVEKTYNWIDDIKDNTDKIPGIRDSINFISSVLQNIGIDQEKSFITSLAMNSIMIVLILIVVVIFIWNILKVSIIENKPEESNNDFI